jgi:hypothetical protein
VKVKRLDTLICEYGIERVDLIKIDVEGHEPAVLEGLGDYLRRFSPTILIEILTDEVGAKVEGFLTGSEYKYFYLDEQKSTIREVGKLTRQESYNYLVCSEQVAAGLL